MIEASRTPPPDRVNNGCGNGGRIFTGTYAWIYPIVTTGALTGLRKVEFLGLIVDDVDLHLNRIFARPSAHRLLKAKRATRTGPIWPQLRHILPPYITESGGELDELA